MSLLAALFIRNFYNSKKRGQALSNNHAVHKRGPVLPGSVQLTRRRDTGWASRRCQEASQSGCQRRSKGDISCQIQTQSLVLIRNEKGILAAQKAELAKALEDAGVGMCIYASSVCEDGTTLTKV